MDAPGPGVAAEEQPADFRLHAGRVLARRNKRDLALAATGGRNAKLLRQVGRRQGVQLELIARKREVVL